MGYKQTGQEVREILFDKYNKNLYLLAKSMPNLRLDTSKYYCPLCLIPYKKEDLYGTDPLLTLEHIVPQSAKGKLVTLTCKQCNNNLGSKIDSELKKQEEFEKFLQSKNGKINGKVKFDDGLRISSYINSNIDGSNLFLNLNHKSSLYNMVKTKFNNNGTMNMEFNFPNSNKAKLAYLKAAYLYAFSKLGYPFVFTQNIQRIRKIILNSDEINQEFLLSQKVHYGLNLIISPNELYGYLVCLKIGNSNYTIILPGALAYSNWDNIKKYKQLDYINIENHDILTNPEQFHLPISHWEKKIN
jgi:hypothetical protein